MSYARLLITNHGCSPDGDKEASWQSCFPNSDVGRCYMCDCEITHSDFYSTLVSTKFNNKKVDLITPMPACSSCNNVIQASISIEVTDPRLIVLSKLRLNRERLDKILEIFREAQRSA